MRLLRKLPAALLLLAMLPACQKDKGGHFDSSYAVNAASYSNYNVETNETAGDTTLEWIDNESVSFWDNGSSVNVTAASVSGGKVVVPVSGSASKIYGIRASKVSLSSGKAEIGCLLNGAVSDAAVSYVVDAADKEELSFEPLGAILMFTVAYENAKSIHIDLGEAVFPMKIEFDQAWKRMKVTSKTKSATVKTSGPGQYYLPVIPDVQIKSYTVELLDASGEVIDAKSGPLQWKPETGTLLDFGIVDKEGEPIDIDPDIVPAEFAADAVKNMGIGLNLCSTFEAIWEEQFNTPRSDINKFETMNGNGKTTQATMDAFAQAGFRCVRIPVTWWPHMDNVNATIDRPWLDRLGEVVQYCFNAGMYCIINMHQDTGTLDGHWLIADMDTYPALSSAFCNIWQQVAEYFKDYDYKLLFEGYNELADASTTWNYPRDVSSLTAANQLNQDFVNTVRRTGGKNGTRNLVVATYTASATAKAMAGFKMPRDVRDGHLIVEIHSYVPSAFITVQPTGRPNFVATTDVPDIKAVFDPIKTYILDKGWPCIMGEYGASPFYFSSDYSVKIPRPAADRAEHAGYYTAEALKYGIVPIYWYNPMEGRDRTTGIWTYPEVKDAIVQAWTDYLSEQ